MFTKKLLNLSRVMLIGVGAIVITSLAVACNDDDDFSRKKRLNVFTDSETQEPSTNVVCRVTGGSDTLYIQSNVEYEMKFRTSDDDKSWIEFSDLGYNAKLNAQMLRIDYKASADTYVKRTGTLSLVYPDDYLGQFVVFTQGFSTRLAENFDWLNTGSDIPYNTIGENLYSKWSTAQKDIGWTTPVLGSNTEAYLYNKKGYVKLGDGTHAAQLLTPDLAKMVADSVVILSFKAVAYVAENGEQDGNELTISVENGGMFNDETTSRTLTLPYYEATDDKVAETMWANCTFNLPISTDNTNVFTGKTTIRFSIPEGKNRVFIDDVYVYIVDSESLYILEQTE